MANSILIAHWDAERLESLAKYLKENGFEPLSAANGTEVLALAEKHTPQVVVMSSFLKEVDPQEVCRKLKGTDKYKNVPFFLVLPDDADSKPFEDLGVKEFVDEPFANDRLMHRINVLLKYGTDVKGAAGKGAKNNLIPVVVIILAVLLFAFLIYKVFMKDKLDRHGQSFSAARAAFVDRAYVDA